MKSGQIEIKVLTELQQAFRDRTDTTGNTIPCLGEGVTCVHYK